MVRKYSLTFKLLNKPVRKHLSPERIAREKEVKPLESYKVKSNLNKTFSEV